MKVVILSAGQGKRLLPMTADRPKCILPVRGQTMIEWQIDELAKCGIDQVNVVLGYAADKVEQTLRRRYGEGKITRFTMPLTPCPTIWSAAGRPMIR